MFVPHDRLVQANFAGITYIEIRCWASSSYCCTMHADFTRSLTSGPISHTWVRLASMDMFARTLVKSCCIHPLAPAGEACSSVDLPLRSEGKSAQQYSNETSDHLVLQKEVLGRETGMVYNVKTTTTGYSIGSYHSCRVRPKKERKCTRGGARTRDLPRVRRTL